MSPSAKSKTDGNNDITHANIIAIMIASLPNKFLQVRLRLLVGLMQVLYIMQWLSV